MEEQGKGNGWGCLKGLAGLLMVFFFFLIRLLGNSNGFVVGVPWVEAERG